MIERDPTRRTRREVLRIGAATVAAGLTGWASAHRDASAGFSIGVCRSVEDGAVAAAGGAAYLEVSCREWLIPDKPRDLFLERLEVIRDAPIPVLAANSFLPGSMPCVGPEYRPLRVLRYAEVALRRAREAGMRVLTFGSGAARRIPDGYPRADAELEFVGLLARLAPIAAEHKMLLCVEPLQQSETNMINRVSEARRLVSAVRHPNLGITADLFHMMREDEGPDAIREAGALVRHVHVAERRRRSAPGRGGDDFRPYFRALRDVDYDGLVSIECRWDDLKTELPRAVRTLRDHESAGAP